jgi:UDP-4-amino-4-deoxy-L-arabinose-oxoglutarate aminotransferase
MIDNVPFFVRNYPVSTENEIVNVLRSGFLTSGKIGIHVEHMLESYFDVAGAALMNSWTNGAVVALSCLGIGEGDEVIVPAMTFVATASSVKCVNAEPVLCDVCPESGNISWEFIQATLTHKTKAIFLVHMYGLMVDVKSIRNSLDDIGRQDVLIIEDAAHCFEGELDNYKPGKYSKCAIFSFYATKNISCGEGGAVISNDKEFIDECKIARLHGMTGTAYDRYMSKSFKHYDVETFGYKANLPDLLACMLPDQISACDLVLVLRENAAQTYINSLQPLIENGHLSLQEFDTSRFKHARHLFPIFINERPRDSIIDKLNSAGIGVAVNFRSLTDLTEYNSISCENAEKWGSSCISLPFFPTISEEQIAYVAKQLSLALII